MASAVSCDQLAPRPKLTVGIDDGEGPILIGHFATMTGPEANFGQSTDHAVRLAVEERNARGGIKGRKIELVTLDDAGKSQEAGTAVTRLITGYGVQAILGEVASGLSLAGGRVAQAYGVPMVSPSSTNNRVTLIGNMVSRVCFIDDFQGYVVAKFAHDNLHATRVAILYDQQQAYSKGLMTTFDAAFRAMGGTITTSQAYTGGDVDLSAQLQSIKDTSPEAIFVPGYYTDAGNVAIQARKIGIAKNVPLLGGDGWDSPKLAQIGKDDIAGSYYANHYSFEDTRPAVQEFVARFKARWGGVPDGLAALGYDAADLLFDAIERTPNAPVVVRDDLAKAIADTKGFPGVTGKITLDERRNPVKSAVMLQMQYDGHVTELPAGTPETFLGPHYVASVQPPTGPPPEIKPLEDKGGGDASIATKLLQTLVNTIALGALYALIALGYTLVYGVLRFINFAHSDVFTFGAWSSFTLAMLLGWGSGDAPWLAMPVMLLLVMAICALLGVTIERLAYRPLRRAPRLNVLITAIGVSLFLEHSGQLGGFELTKVGEVVVKWPFGPNPQKMPPLISDDSLLTIAGVHIRTVDVVVVVLAVLLVGLLQWLVYRTKLGRAMRAVSFDERVAALMGINVDRVITITFAVGSALAAAGGLLFAVKYPALQATAHSTWVLLGLTAFVAAVVGGIGDVRGAAVGALIIAGVQEFGAAYLSSQLRDVYVFTVLIGLLLVRPRGLFGRVMVEKV
ncbi:MAG TPA: ABC transporter substrate-binding protein [Kofleriaceae bacterium]|nr:ABC transporter substrate-binding protein [Kofleriaceae bacterium]